MLLDVAISDGLDIRDRFWCTAELSKRPGGS